MAALTKTALAPKLPAERPGQPGGRRDTNRKERTKTLTEAALALFLQRGIEAVTIEDITTKAGVAKGSFYRYFDDKTALVASLFAQTHDDTSAFFDDSIAKLRTAQTKEEAVASYEVIGEGVGRLLLGSPDVVLLYLQESRAPAEGSRAPARKLADLVREKSLAHTQLARERGLLRPFSAELSSLAVIGAAERLLYGLLVGEEVGDVWEIPGALTSLILDGIRAPEASSAER